MALLIRVTGAGGDEEKPQGAIAGDGDKREAGAANQINRYFVAMQRL